MTTTTTSAGSSTSTPSRDLVLAVLGVATSSVLSAVGTFWDLTDNESSSEHGVGDYLFTLGVIAVAAAVVFGLVVRTAASGNAGRRALVLGIVGVVSIGVFWAGLPMVLVAGAVACALVDRDRRGSFSGGSTVGLALSALVTVAAVVLAVAG